MNTQKLMMIFVDGLGIGKNNVEINPLVRFKFNFFNSFFGQMPTLRNSRIKNKYFSIFPVSSTLGVAGLPQSGTGQTAIFCGFNASKYIGKHFGPYPYSTLKPLIIERNIFSVLEKKNFKTFFSNAYPERFFKYLRDGRRTLSVTTFSYLSAGKKLNDLNDLLNDRAITAEITNEIWNSNLGYDLPVIKPQKSGEKFYNISKEYNYNLFEYFLTDYAGHSQDFEYARAVFEKLDGFIEGIVNKMNLDKDTLFLISDHGNIEDLSVKTHTRNPAFAMVIGKNHEHFSRSIKFLYDVKKTIMSFLEN